MLRIIIQITPIALLLILTFPGLLQAQQLSYNLKAILDERSGEEQKGLPRLDSLIRTSYSPSSAKGYPIIIRLKEGHLTEEPNGELIEGALRLRLEYALLKAEDTLRLNGYNNSLRYRRSSNHTKAPQQAVQQLVSKSKVHFEQWLAENSGSQPAFASRFSLTFEAVKEARGPDTIYYHAQQPLSWNNFKASPQGNRFGASIFANFGYTGTDTLINGHFQVTVNLKVYMLEQQSWVRSDSRNAYSLNHEQRHLQLAYLASREFEQMVKQDMLTPENYRGRLGYWYLQAYRKMNQLQEAYDTETQHGMNEQTQERWNQWIDSQIIN